MNLSNSRLADVARAARAHTTLPQAEAPLVTAAVAVAAVKQRISAIVALPQAKGREDLAWHIALKTEVSVETARSLLGSASAARASVGFDAAMCAAGNPNLGTGAGPSVAQQSGAASWEDSMKQLIKACR